MLKLASIEPTELLPLHALPQQSCKYPVEENWNVAGHFLFCAKATRPAERYCPHHMQRCYRAPEQKRKG